MAQTSRIVGIFAAVILVLSAPSYAQNVVGRSLVDGQQVELLSDGTWRFTDRATSTTDCRVLPAGLEFCGIQNGWQETPAPNADIAAQFRFDDRHYGQFVIEEVGLDDGMSVEFMRRVIIENAAAVSGSSPDLIPILGSEPARMSKVDGETVIYFVDFDGLDVVFANAIFVDAGRTVQAITFAIGKEFSQRHQELHQTFLDLIRVDGEG